MVVGETQGQRPRLLELEVEGHGVLQSEVNANQRSELLVQNNLGDVILGDDEVRVLEGLNAVVLVVVNIGCPRVDGIVRLVAVRDTDRLEYLTYGWDVGQTVIGEVPIGQRDAWEGVERNLLCILTRIGGDEGVEQHIHRARAIAFREIVARDAVEGIFVHILDPLRVVAGDAFGDDLSVLHQVVEQPR